MHKYSRNPHLSILPTLAQEKKTHRNHTPTNPTNMVDYTKPTNPKQPHNI